MGFSCSRTTNLKASCDAVVEAWSGEHEVEVVTSADVMKTYGISNTPALVVDDQLLFQGCAMSSKGIKALLEKRNG